MGARIYNAVKFAARKLMRYWMLIYGMCIVYECDSDLDEDAWD